MSISLLCWIVQWRLLAMFCGVSLSQWCVHCIKMFSPYFMTLWPWPCFFSLQISLDECRGSIVLPIVMVADSLPQLSGEALGSPSALLITGKLVSSAVHLKPDQPLFSLSSKRKKKKKKKSAEFSPADSLYFYAALLPLALRRSGLWRTSKKVVWKIKMYLGKSRGIEGSDVVGDGWGGMLCNFRWLNYILFFFLC